MRYPPACLLTWRILAFALLAFPCPLLGQAGVATLTLGPPRFTTGDLELHRVRGAGFLSDGRIAIANAGTFSVMIVNRQGGIEKRFGREGGGPGDFGGLDRLATFGDTIVTWDGLNRRITLWRPDGTVLRTFSPPPAVVQRSALSLEAFASPSSYIATVRSYPPQQTNGIYLNTASLFAIDGAKRLDLGQQPWAYMYFYAEGTGSATYTTPFLGESLVAAAAGKILTLPLGETRVALRRADGTSGAVPLSIRPVTGRERAKAYGDSMIEANQDQGPAWERKFRAIYGPEFPLVERQAVAQRAVTVGGTVWFQEFQQPRNRMAAWWIVDARREALIGRVMFPASSTVLGGNERQVLVRLVDEDGVQSVAVFDFPGR